MPWWADNVDGSLRSRRARRERPHAGSGLAPEAPAGAPAAQEPSPPSACRSKPPIRSSRQPVACRLLRRDASRRLRRLPSRPRSEEVDLVDPIHVHEARLRQELPDSRLAHQGVLHRHLAPDPFLRLGRHALKRVGSGEGPGSADAPRTRRASSRYSPTSRTRAPVEGVAEDTTREPGKLLTARNDPSHHGVLPQRLREARFDLCLQGAPPSPTWMGISSTLARLGWHLVGLSPGFSPGFGWRPVAARMSVDIHRYVRYYLSSGRLLSRYLSRKGGRRCCSNPQSSTVRRGRSSAE